MKWYNKEAWISTIVTIIVGFLIVILLGGCKSKEYITVPEYHTEYICRTDTFAKLDSIYLKDSVYVYQKGDTVYHNKVTYRDRCRNVYKVKTDTIFKHDSISCPVKKELTKSEKFFISMGKKASIWILALILLGIVGVIYLPIIMKKKE